MRKIVLAVAMMATASWHTAGAEGIDTLVELGRSMADIKKAGDEETRAFNRVKAAIESGAIRKGIPKEDISGRYGEPVIANDDSATGRQKWVYKPSDSSFFDGTRIYLLFDGNGALDEIRVIPGQEQSSDKKPG